ISFSHDITAVSGIGTKKQSLYKKLGICTVGDLILHMPRDYFSLTETDESLISVGEKCVITARVIKKSSEQRIRAGLSVFKVFCEARGKILKLTFFNSKFSVAALEYNREYLFCGSVDALNLTSVEMTAPLVFPLENRGKLLPLYPLTAGLTQKTISRDILTAIGNLEAYPQLVPKICEEENNIVSLEKAVGYIHSPKNLQEAEIGLDRVIFEEFFLFSLNLAIIKSQREKLILKPWENTSLEEFYSKLEFKPTNAQKRVVGEILEDVKSQRVMNRMIEGDVGSGKTLIAVISAYLAVKNGFQASVMAPTETLALQHLKNFSKILQPFNMKCCVVLGSQKKKERDAVLKEIYEGKADVIIGTHAILSETTIFKNLGLVVTDEQHRFGVNQRGVFSKKGNGCHSLVMSATPIPRSLSLVLYG
ncbi:MAG: DEAD/DEAH box helicase, partial [Oscillospiraceae bacterium]